MHDTNITPSINKVSMLILALLPILSWYKIPFPVSLGYAIILFLSAYTIVKAGFRINVVPTIFWIVFAYVCFMWIYNHGFAFWTLLPPGGWVFFIFVLAILWGVISFDMGLFKKYMRWVVMISGVLFWIQLALYTATGNQQICFVPNLTGAFTYEDYTYADIVKRQLDGGLPCSIFLEKSYLAYYFLTYLAIIWFDNKNKLFSKEIIFVIATLIASRSGTALVGFVVLFAVKMFSTFWNKNVRKRILLIFFIVPLIVGAFYVYAETELGQQMLSRTEELSDEGTSGYARVVNGYMMFDQLTPEQKVFGISDARERFGYEKKSGAFVFYVNGVQSILLNLGYIGILLYFLFYANVFHKVGLTSRMCVVVLLVMSLLEANYLNSYMMLLTIIPCAEVYLKRNVSITKYYN